MVVAVNDRHDQALLLGRWPSWGGAGLGRPGESHPRHLAGVLIIFGKENDLLRSSGACHCPSSSSSSSSLE